MKVTLLLVAVVAAFAAPAVYAAPGSHEPARVSAAASLATRIQTGLATYYARGFEGMRTASGEIFRHASFMAAHPTWPIGTIARVTNLATGRSVEVRIADRGPAARPRRRGVIIDLSRSAAQELNMVRAGVVKVSVEVLEWGKKR